MIAWHVHYMHYSCNVKCCQLDLTAARLSGVPEDSRMCGADTSAKLIAEKGENGGDPIGSEEFCLLMRRFILVVSS